MQPSGLISIHALREEGDSPRWFSNQLVRPFLSTPSARRATIALVVLGDSPCNFYPRPPRGGRQEYNLPSDVAIHISIHALREEGDGELLHSAGRHVISIHALREEGDDYDRRQFEFALQFLSTPSARRATPAGNAEKVSG